MDSFEARQRIQNNLPTIVESLNNMLRGDGLDSIRDILFRIDRTGQTPSWFDILRNEHRLINKDGKTAGSVIEKLFVCAVEKTLFSGDKMRLSVNPAKGVDIPELKLGIKSPSTNYCTSEPFFSVYERILGNEYDAVILLTNYQEAKGRDPYVLQINDIKYLKGSEIADKNLCLLCRELRDEYENDIVLKRILKFIAYANQSDWEAKKLLSLLNIKKEKTESIDREISQIELDYIAKNKKLREDGKEIIPIDILDGIKRIREVTPRYIGIVDALDNWVALTQKDNARLPNDNEWERFLRSPLDGKIGMSLALQWRYNFGPLFQGKDEVKEDE